MSDRKEGSRGLGLEWRQLSAAFPEGQASHPAAGGCPGGAEAEAGESHTPAAAPATAGRLLPGRLVYLL